MKEFYGNLKDRKNLKFYVREIWGCLLEREPFHSGSSSKKGKIAQILRSLRRIPTSMRLTRSLLVDKESGRAHRQFPMPT